MPKDKFTENTNQKNVAEVTPPLSFYGPKFPKTPGLHRMQKLMQNLGNPQEKLKVIHVAGTNGKGSVTSYLASIAAEADQTVGVYTSPFLERFTERIRVWNGKKDLDAYLSDDSVGEIDADSLASLSFQVRECAEMLVDDGMERPTEFELLTALAFLYFEEKKCDFVVLETGLGGRLDSTNIVEKPIACVITALGFDHMAVLGDTIEQIAKEKAGIIKKDVPVFLFDPKATDLSEEDALAATNIIKNECSEKQASLYMISSNQIEQKKFYGKKQRFKLSFFDSEFKIALLGQNQLLNAALAVKAASGFFSEIEIKKGLAKMRLNGRFEVFSENPLVILDGGHNPQGAKVLRQNLDFYYGDFLKKNPPVFVIGVMKDKDYEGILKALFLNMSHLGTKIFCVMPDNPRALSPKSLKEALICQFYAHVSQGNQNLNSNVHEKFYKNDKRMYNMQDMIVCASVKEACKEAFFLSQKNKVPVICTGSFFLIGEVRTLLRKQAKEEIQT